MLLRNNMGQFVRRAQEEQAMVNPLQNALNQFLILVNILLTIISWSPFILFIYVIIQHFNVRKMVWDIILKTICNCTEEKVNGRKEAI